MCSQSKSVASCCLLSPVCVTDNHIWLIAHVYPTLNNTEWFFCGAVTGSCDEHLIRLKVCLVTHYDVHCVLFKTFLSLSVCYFLPSLPLLLSLIPFLFPLSDLDKMDSEKDEMNQADITALHHFYSRHIRDLPDDQALTELFAQVKLGNT